MIDAIEELRGREMVISHRVRGTRARWQQMAVTNAEQALAARLANRQHVASRFDALAKVLGLEDPPMRLECYDISHSSGEATVASCVVFGPEGPIKSDYRRFNIEGVTAGDDYAAMHQALTRRYSRIKAGEGKLPDVLLVDGGKGQMSMARDVLNELQVPDLILLGVAKGTTRKAGFETLYLNDAAHEFTLPGDSPALHLIQQIRDEAHRFAITGHRAPRPGAPRPLKALQVSGRPGVVTCSNISADYRNCPVPASMKSQKHLESVKSWQSRFMQTCTASRMPAHLVASCADEYP
ncbi:UvrABC system protein C [Pseudomonas amygdali pv. eriobotryae]|uniref:UvrABC system protein C n=1 Tax=Pseudomonas amygdali pv. eriobotryae TaxID=129137 RepID=A0A3M3WFR1_PSEA0|nr:UvrABC system protein C [Pseudomonas amygdali pv. eriobotryae]